MSEKQLIVNPEKISIISMLDQIATDLETHSDPVNIELLSKLEKHSIRITQAIINLKPIIT
jgi:hypothetical protein